MKKTELREIIRKEILKEAKDDYDVSYKKIRVIIKNGHKYDDTEDKLYKFHKDIGKLTEKYDFYPAKTITISDK
jgi:hypothetical protein